MQFVDPAFPFGGIGKSGYGCVHGKHGFEQVSHMRPIMTKLNYNGFPTTMRYPPYGSVVNILLTSPLVDKTMTYS